jgi:hypothetical protein
MRHALLAGWLFSCLSADCGGQTTGTSGQTTGGGPTTGGMGAGPDTMSCTIVQTINAGGTSFTQTLCIEASGLTPDQINAEKMTCSSTLVLDGGLTQTSSFSLGPCARANALGGCRVASGSYTSVIWYYDNSVVTVDQLKMICSSSGGMYVSAS